MILGRWSQRFRSGGNWPKGEMETALFSNIHYVYDDAIPLLIGHSHGFLATGSVPTMSVRCHVPLPLWLVFVRHNFVNVGIFPAFLGQDCRWLLNGVKLPSLHVWNLYTGCRINDFILPE